MTTRFKIDSIHLETLEGPVDYTFDSPLTVFAGPVGVGKTTFFELIKYALGGSAELAQVATDYVQDVQISVAVGDERLQLARSLDPTKRATVRVTDLIERERLGDRFVGRDPSLSELLLDLLGLPTDIRAASRSQNTLNAGNKISFADVFTYMYVRQADINRDIASSQESVREPKRKTVFELLFGLTDEAILRATSEIAGLNAALQKAEHDYNAVLQFLRESNTTDQDDARRSLESAARDEVDADSRLASLRQSLDPADDLETLALRDLLNAAERRVAEAQQLAAVLAQQQVEYGKERRRISQDIDRLNRLRDAGHRLANFEFMVCPRCMQSVNGRDVDSSLCHLCLQSDPVVDVNEFQSNDSYEQQQLSDQLEEIDEQVEIGANQLVEAQRAIEHRLELVKRLSEQLTVRTRERITPQLQAFNDTVSRLAEAKATQAALAGVLRQWAQADELGVTAENIRANIESLRSVIRIAEHALQQRRTEIFDELDEEFEETVSAIGIPGVERAHIDRKSYLPFLNGQHFRKFSPAGGGIRTTTQVAYWLTLMSVAMRRRDTKYPAFLLVDGPRTSLNDDGLAAALYRRIVTQVDAAGGQLQVIIGDRELPDIYQRSYIQLNFDYDRPTIGAVPHPGPNAVRTLTRPESS